MSVLPIPRHRPSLVSSWQLSSPSSSFCCYAASSSRDAVNVQILVRSTLLSNNSEFCDISWSDSDYPTFLSICMVTNCARFPSAFCYRAPPQMYQQQSGYYPPYGQTGGPGPQGYGQQQQGSYYGGREGGQDQQYAPPQGPPPNNADYTAPPAGSPPPVESQYAPPPGPPPQAHVAGNNAGKGESAAYYNR